MKCDKCKIHEAVYKVYRKMVGHSDMCVRCARNELSDPHVYRLERMRKAIIEGMRA